MTVWMKAPYAIATSAISAPAASTPAGVTTYFQSETLTPPVATPTSGMTMPSTSAVTILPNAAPMTTATARSTTLPLAMNSLNSATIPMALPSGCSPVHRRLPRQHASVNLHHAIEAGAPVVAGAQRADAGRRAHEHQVPGTQGVEPGQFDQDVGHVPDQVGQAPVLATFAVHVEAEREPAQVADRVRRHQFAHRRAGIEGLAGVPGQAPGLGRR